MDLRCGFPGKFSFRKKFFFFTKTTKTAISLLLFFNGVKNKRAISPTYYQNNNDK